MGQSFLKRIPLYKHQKHDMLEAGPICKHDST